MRYVFYTTMFGFVSYVSFMAGLTVGIVEINEMISAPLFRCVELLNR